jgi:hypothetical protein
LPVIPIVGVIGLDALGPGMFRSLPDQIAICWCVIGVSWVGDNELHGCSRV